MWTLPDGSILRVDHTRHHWYLLNDRPIPYKKAQRLWDSFYPKNGRLPIVEYLTLHPVA